MHALRCLCIKSSRHLKLIFYYIEALYQLTRCKLLMVFTPFRHYENQCGYPQSETLHDPLWSALKDIQAISTVLRVLPRYLPWKSKCLDQAMAASYMLKRRKLQYTLYFGLTHAGDKSKRAHAWLRSGKHWIVGYQPHTHYAIVGVYAWVR